ncbi:DUF2231 domain-containing protein [Mesorhizobium sp. M1227]
MHGVGGIWSTGNAFWAEASFWLLGFVLLMSAAAALAGFTDFLGNSRVRSINAAWHHMVGNVVAVVLALASFMLRLSAGAAEGALPWAWRYQRLSFCCSSTPAGKAERLSTNTG